MTLESHRVPLFPSLSLLFHWVPTRKIPYFQRRGDTPTSMSLLSLPYLYRKGFGWGWVELGMETCQTPRAFLILPCAFLVCHRSSWAKSNFVLLTPDFPNFDSCCTGLRGYVWVFPPSSSPPSRKSRIEFCVHKSTWMLPLSFSGGFI